jgi:hypothetical protein
MTLKIGLTAFMFLHSFCYLSCCDLLEFVFVKVQFFGRFHKNDCSLKEEKNAYSIAVGNSLCVPNMAVQSFRISKIVA